MKRVFQDKFGVPDGNCFTACVASVLEVELNDLPHIDTSKPYWVRDLNGHLSHVYGLGLWFITRNDGKPFEGHPPALKTLCIVTAKSPRGDFHHAVCAEVWCNGDQLMMQVVHDPYPGGDPVDLGTWIDITVFVPLDMGLYSDFRFFLRDV